MVSLILNNIKDQILQYLFNDNNKEINLFVSNKEVKLNKRWDPILNYPNELFILRRTNISRNIIVKKVIDGLLANINRVIHPILLIIFFYELQDYIKYTEISKENEDDDIVIQLTSKNKKVLKEIRPQINSTFKLYWKLLNDKKIKTFASHYFGNDLVEEIINSLYYKITVEQLINLNTTIIETKKIRFNDLCLSLDISDEVLENNLSKNKYDNFIKNKEILSEKQQEFQNKILIEINENHHLPSIDFLRKTTIYEATSKTIIDYNIKDDNLDLIYSKIMKEISKLIFKNYDEDLGFIFYLITIENMSIGDATFFLNIHNNTTKKNKGLSVKIILDIFKVWEYVDKKNFMKLIKLELDNEVYFIEQNDDFKNSLLSSLGVDRLIFLPRKSDFINCDDLIRFVKMYNKFRVSFFKTIETFLTSDDENNIIIHLLKKLNSKEEFEKFKQPLIDHFLEKIKNDDLILNIEEEFSIELDKYLPILMKSKSKFNKIDINIMKNSFGEKVSNLLEEHYDSSKSEIQNRKLIPKKIINYVSNY
jgi:hypothetical protein